ncbi:MAG TPA: MFS transporter [Verrucomicrobiae bacterium]
MTTDAHPAAPSAEITRLTFRSERWRAFSSGILETAATTFLLLIAVKELHAGATAKALIAAGGSVGLLLGPLTVSFVQARGMKPSDAAARMAMMGAAAFVVMALLPFLPVYVIGSIVALTASTAVIPLITQVYQENYPDKERGRMLSKSFVIRIATAAIFNELAGRALTGHLEKYQWLLLVFAAAYVVAAYWLAKIPSTPLHVSGGTHPFKSLRYVKEDALFRQTLVAWMLMGFANLMMIPLRVEYLANPQYGYALTAGEIAFLVGVVPNLARLVLSPFWGWAFDHMNFFMLRVVLNIGFALGILSFFTGETMTGMLIGAIIFGASNAGGDVAWSLWVTKFTAPERVADYMSVHTFCTGLRGLFAPLAAFHLAAHFTLIQLGWFAATLIGLSCAVLIPEIPWGKKAKQSAPLTEEVQD